MRYFKYTFLAILLGLSSQSYALRTANIAVPITVGALVKYLPTSFIPALVGSMAGYNESSESFVAGLVVSGTCALKNTYDTYTRALQPQTNNRWSNTKNAISQSAHLINKPIDTTNSRDMLNQIVRLKNSQTAMQSAFLIDRLKQWQADDFKKNPISASITSFLAELTILWPLYAASKYMFSS